MRQLFRVLAVSLIVAVTASAQMAEVAITGGWSAFNDRVVGETFGEDDQFTIDNGVRIGARISFNRWFLGHELSYAFQRSGLNLGASDFGGMTIQNFYYNFVVHATPEGTAIRPFVTAGGGVSTFFPPGVSSFSGAGQNKFGYNYGGGLKFRLSERFGIRFDVRDHVTGKPFDLPGPGGEGRLHNVEYSSGFAFLF